LEVIKVIEHLFTVCACPDKRNLDCIHIHRCM